MAVDQSLFAQRNSASATPYLQLTQASSGNRAFIQNRQLCAVIGVAQKTGGEFQVTASPQMQPQAPLPAPPQPTSGRCFSLSPNLHPQHSQSIPSTQAATIIVGDPDGNASGTVQYSNDKVDSINLLSPNAMPGCISLPPRSARVFQLILPQSATALSLRPHPISSGSASVIQLTTTGHSPIGTTTISLKQTPTVVDASTVECQDNESLSNVLREGESVLHAQEATSALEFNSSGEFIERQTGIHSKARQPDVPSLITLAEWEQV